jgi:sulfur-oxidizing protein SoxY
MRQGQFIFFCLCLLAGCPPGAAWAQTPLAGRQADPYPSSAWAALHKQYLGGEPFVFDDRVQVTGPAFAEDAMNVPLSIDAKALPGVTQMVVLVERNPIRKVLVYYPQAMHPRVSFHFKLEQASAVRAAAKTRDGVWHVGSTWVEASGGGCTVAGGSRKDGSWSRTLGQVSGRVFGPAPRPRAQSLAPALPDDDSLRLRLKVMHPMDTGLVNGIPAFYLNRLQVSSSEGEPLLRMELFEPVSENPVFSFDFPHTVPGALVLTGSDNNGNRMTGQIENGVRP